MQKWILFIYTLPSQPSRKRAYVWRELKRLGAVYLRDGVAALPYSRELEQRMQAIGERVEEYEGTVDLVLSPKFAPNREEAIVSRFKQDRESEYKELHHACVRFLRDVLHEVTEDDFGFPDVDNLEGELGRLHRWFDQIRERDYFNAPGSVQVEKILLKCDTAFEHFAATAQERNNGTAPTLHDDVFDRLGGPAPQDGESQEMPL